MSNKKLKPEIFSLTPKKNTKIKKSAEPIGSSAVQEQDGSVTIVDSFIPSPKPFLEALNSQLAFTDLDKYIKELKKSARLGEGAKGSFEFIKTDKEEKEDESE